MFRATLEAPKDFPVMPPAMTFRTKMWHPNIYPDGKVCISILHPPGDDPHNESETADLRWRPVLGVETILVSVISLLSDPNDNSPANIDARCSGAMTLRASRIRSSGSCGGPSRTSDVMSSCAPRG